MLFGVFGRGSAGAARSNGTLRGHPPRSASNVTFLSDWNPLITRNPVYDDSSPPLSPAPGVGPAWAWSVPARLHGGSFSEPRRRTLMDLDDWELMLGRAAEGGVLERHENPEALQMGEAKLSVREQARQFEQQALLRSRDSLGSLSSILLREDVTSDLGLLSVMDHSYSPPPLGRDSPPGTGEGPWPATGQRLRTPPVLRRFSSSICSYVTVQPCQIMVEIIPDPPEEPPPAPPAPPSPALSPSPPPAPTHQPPPPPSSLPSRPYKPQYDPQPLPPPSPCPSPPSKHLAPPPPPPLPPPLSPASGDQSRPAVQFAPSHLPPASSLRPVSQRKQPPAAPEAAVAAGAGRTRELKGILKNIQNLADIERSVANMYSQVDKSRNAPPKLGRMPQAVEEPQLSGQSDEPKTDPPKTDPPSPKSQSELTTNCKENETNLENGTMDTSPNSVELSEDVSSHSTLF